MTDAEAAYELFISYAEADRAWVEGYLLDALTRAGVRCHSKAAFALGVPRLLEFERAVQRSQHTLFAPSIAFVAPQAHPSPSELIITCHRWMNTLVTHEEPAHGWALRVPIRRFYQP